MEVELVSVGSAPGIQLPLIPLEFDPNDEQAQSEKAVFISLCTTSKMLALVNPNCGAQFFNYEESNSQATLMYQNSFQGVLDMTNDQMSPNTRVVVTALVVIPIAFSRNGKVQRASIALVGFSDGYLRGYSKTGQVVFSEKLHSEAVTKISFMFTSYAASGKPIYQGTLVLSFGCIVCIIEGYSLVEVIQENVAKMNQGAGWSKHDEDAVSLVYRKWNLKEQVSCIDIALIGHSTPTMYDHLYEASSVTGFETTVRSGPVPEARLISVGENPMIALYKVSKDAGQVNVSEVMHAVASKMKNAVLGKLSQAGGWLGWGAQQQQLSQQMTKTRMADDRLYQSSDLTMDSSIPDNRRSISSITISPLGNLAALVDSFGRVILLDCETITIRRMWKGYRDAQCGWLLVEEECKPQNITSPKSAQCLCIYASRRGILEVWPTMYGRRITGFHVGKGCKLLYLPNTIFTTSELFDGSSTPKSKFEEKERVKGATVVLSPLGNLVKVSVPFPCLSRSDDPFSCDTYLMKKFIQIIKVGNSKEILRLLAEIKSAKFLKQAVDSLIKQYPFSNAPKLCLLDVVNTALKRINHSDPNTKLLFQYLLGSRQLIELKSALENLHPEEATDTIPVQLNEFLQKQLGMQQELGLYTSTMIATYYRKFIPPKKVVKDLDMYGMIQSFKLPSEVGDHLLCGDTQDNEQCDPETIKLHLKDETDSSILDLGSTLFLPHFEKMCNSSSISTILEKSGISQKILLNLVACVFLSGKIEVKNLSTFHHQLYSILLAIVTVKDNEDQHNLWLAVCRQCAITPNVGHAFSIVLLHQKLYLGFEDYDGGSSEMWESVTAEKGHWATLYSNLEVLVHLCNMVGLNALRSLPAVPFDDITEDMERSHYIVDPTRLKLKFFDKVYRNSSMCAASLKNGGPSLITHCLCQWLIKMKYSCDFIGEISRTQVKIPSEVAELVNPLLKLLPCSLDRNHLLVHCAWQTAYTNNEYCASLQYINEMPDPQTISGIFGLLWCLKFEAIVVKSIDNFKRGITLSEDTVELISVCRILLGYLFQFSGTNFDLKLEGDVSKDSITYQSQYKIDLMDIIRSFPCLNSTVIHTCHELLLLFEISIQFQKLAINLLSFFPNWLRNSLKKGLYKSSWQEQIPVQLQQKRLKFLMEAVTVCLRNQSPPKMYVGCDSKAISATDNDYCVDLVNFEDFVFLLGKHWKLDLDCLKNHWACNLFANGFVNQGKNIILMMNDKEAVLGDLLSLAGYMTEQLIQNVQKSSKLSLLAQTPPTLLEWIRKQNLSPAVKKCSEINPTWKSVSQLITLIITYLPEAHYAKDKAGQLDKLVKLMHM